MCTSCPIECVVVVKRGVSTILNPVCTVDCAVDELKKKKSN